MIKNIFKNKLIVQYRCLCLALSCVLVVFCYFGYIFIWKENYALLISRNIYGIETTIPPHSWKDKFLQLSSPAPTKERFESILTNAKAGDAVCQLYMGIFYANGNLVHQDYAFAAEWYLKAAQQGNSRAQRNLALLYECGIGVKQDINKALIWYLKAAKQNDPAALIGVSGFIYSYRRSLLPSWYGSYDTWLMKALITSEIFRTI